MHDCADVIDVGKGLDAKMNKRAFLLICSVLLFLLILSPIIPVVAQGVPLIVYGHIYMPDGSPASGTSVSASCEESSDSTSTGSDGYYQVELSVSKDQTVTVSASKGDLNAGKSFTGGPSTGKKKVDLHLSEAPPPTPPTPATKAPILKLAGLMPSTTALMIGDELEVSGSVENTGEASATAVKVEVYLADVLVGSEALGSIEQGKSSSFEVSITVEESLGTGLKSLKVSVSCEQGASDTTTLASIRVSAPTLAMALRDLEVPPSSTRGASIEVSGRVENAGDKALTGVKLSIYFDGDMVRELDLGDLSMGESREFEAHAAIPPDAEVGEHALLIVVEGDGVRRESTHEISVVAGLESEVGPMLEDAREEIEEAERVMELGRQITSLEDEAGLLDEAMGLYEDSSEAFAAEDYASCKEPVEEALSKLEEATSGAVQKATSAVLSKLEGLESSVANPDLMSLLSGMREAVQQAAQEADPVSAMEKLNGIFNMLSSAERLNQAIQEGEGPGEEAERLRSELRAAKKKTVLAAGGCLVAGLVGGFLIAKFLMPNLRPGASGEMKKSAGEDKEGQEKAKTG